MITMQDEGLVKKRWREAGTPANEANCYWLLVFGYWSIVISQWSLVIG